MSILEKDESLKNNSRTKDKHLSSGGNSPLKDEILFVLEEKTENITINSSSFILFDIERKYLTFF